MNSASFERVEGLVVLIGPSSRADVVEVMGEGKGGGEMGEIFDETIGEVVEKTSVLSDVLSDDIEIFLFSYVRIGKTAAFFIVVSTFF